MKTGRTFTVRFYFMVCKRSKERSYWAFPQSEAVERSAMGSGCKLLSFFWKKKDIRSIPNAKLGKK